MQFGFNLLFLIYLSYNSFGQITTFERNYDTLGCYYSNCVVEYLDNGYVLCGSSYSPATAQDAAIIRIDSLGNIMWVKQYGTSSTDGAVKCITTSDSNLLIVGIKEDYSTTDGKLWILKLDQNGDTLWTRTYRINTGRNFPTDVETCKSGGFIISGYCSTQMNPSAIAMLVKIDSVGNLLWSKTYNYSTISQFYSCKEIMSGGFVCTGGIDNSGQADIFIVRTDSIGDTLWTKALGNVNADFGASVIQSQDSNIIIAGSTYDPILNNWNIDLRKLSLSGGIMWEKTLGDNRENSAHTIVQLADGNFLIGGTTNTIANGYQGLIIKVDGLGDSLWVSTFGGMNSEIGYDVILGSDGGIVFTGMSDVFIPNPHTAMYCIKLDSLGQFNTKVYELSETSTYTLYPNPAINSITIELSTVIHVTKFLFQLKDIFGKLVFEQRISSQRQFVDISSVSKGFYYYLISNNKKVIGSNKLIVLE